MSVCFIHIIYIKPWLLYMYFCFYFLKLLEFLAVPWPHLLLYVHSRQVNLGLEKENELPNFTEQGSYRISFIWLQSLCISFCCTTLLLPSALCWSCFLKSSCNLPSFEFSSHFQIDGRKEVGFRIQNFSFQSILLKKICLYS